MTCCHKVEQLNLILRSIFIAPRCCVIVVLFLNEEYFHSNFKWPHCLPDVRVCDKQILLCIHFYCWLGNSLGKGHGIWDPMNQSSSPTRETLGKSLAVSVSSSIKGGTVPGAQDCSEVIKGDNSFKVHCTCLAHSRD